MKMENMFPCATHVVFGTMEVNTAACVITSSRKLRQRKVMTFNIAHSVMLCIMCLYEMNAIYASMWYHPSGFHAFPPESTHIAVLVLCLCVFVQISF